MGCSPRRDGLRAVFLGAAMTRAGHLLPPAEQAEFWCDSLWADRRGWAITAVGHEPYLTETGKLSHRRFEQRVFRWPTQKAELLESLLKLAATCDIYAAPLLRDKPNRRKADSAPIEGRFLWLDADEWDDDRQAELDRLEVPVLVVESGSPGHLHLYPDAGEILPGATIARASQQLSAVCRTDTFGGAEKVMRLPGTLNHKPRVLGGEAGIVRLRP